jgi:hypothetical protein
VSVKSRLDRLERSAGDSACPQCGCPKRNGPGFIVFSGLHLLPAGPAAAVALDADGELFLETGEPAPPPCALCGYWSGGFPIFYSRSYVEYQRMTEAPGSH